MAQISLEHISMTYAGSSGPVAALNDISLQIDAGEPIALIGPSGCGKSTLLLLIAGLLVPTSGTVSIKNALVAGPRKETSLILQEYGLLPWKTVAENAGLGLKIRKAPKGEIAQEVRASLETVGLEQFAKSYPGELSGGMRQRLALARAIALESDVLLMDEPLSALDALTREELQGMLLDLWRTQRHTQILVTHSIEEAVFLGKRIVLLSPRPGHIASIIDNPTMGNETYRNSPEFYQKCAEVRSLLVDSGALHVTEVAHIAKAQSS